MTGEFAPLDSDGDGAISDQESFAAYTRYREAESTYQSMKYSGIAISPRLVAGGPHWGVAFTGDFDLSPLTGDGYESISYAVNRRLCAVAGLGLNLGGLALGANLRYGRDSAYSVSDVNYADGLGDRFFTQLLNPESSVDGEGELAAGVGLLFSLSTLNLGLYNDNIVPFLYEDKVDDGFLNALLDTTNLGLSWMPSDDKSGRKSPITLMVAADIDDLGDEDSRRLAAGAELGLDILDFLVATARLGYSQPLGVGDVDVEGDGKELWEMGLDDIDIDSGRITAGLTAKFWIAKVDLGVAIPMSLITFYTTNMTDIYPSVDDPTDEYLSLNLTVSASF